MGPATLLRDARIAPLRNKRSRSVLVGCDLCPLIIRVGAVGFAEPDPDDLRLAGWRPAPVGSGYRCQDCCESEAVRRAS